MTCVPVSKLQRHQPNPHHSHPDDDNSTVCLTPRTEGSDDGHTHIEQPFPRSPKRSSTQSTYPEGQDTWFDRLQEQLQVNLSHEVPIRSHRKRIKQEPHLEDASLFRDDANDRRSATTFSSLSNAPAASSTVQDKDDKPIVEVKRMPAGFKSEAIFNNEICRDRSSGQEIPRDEISSLLISVKPPKQPKTGPRRPPCDIVLVLDVSGSMYEDAPMPGTKEESGLTILNLAQHAAKSVIQALGPEDRVGVVKFAGHAEVVCELEPVEYKWKLCKAVEGLRAGGGTNMWDGIRKGLELWDTPRKTSRSEETGNANAENADTGNTKAMFILTDGHSNTGDPNHWEADLENLLGERSNAKNGSKPNPSIHTVGFGNDIPSGLLQLLARAGKGQFAYISDPCMIATVFVHAIANLMTTFATMKLSIELPENLHLSHCYTDIQAVEPDKLKKPANGGEGRFIKPEEVFLNSSKVIEMGNVSYGQSRDYLLRYYGKPGRAATGRVTLSFSTPEVDKTAAIVDFSFDRLPSATEVEARYHDTRTKLCEFIINFCRPTEYKQSINDEAEEMSYARNVKGTISKQLYATRTTDDNIESLLKDLEGEGMASANRHGQITEAIDPKNGCLNYRRWGAHYLRSLAFAYATQTCNNFKDPGPGRFGIDSPLFIENRNNINDTFNSLKLTAPGPTDPYKKKPSAQATNAAGWNSVSNGCWAQECMVELSNGALQTTAQLSRNSIVKTLAGDRQVREILISGAENVQMRTDPVTGLVITPWHPIAMKGVTERNAPNTWIFPRHSTGWKDTFYTGSIYTLLLENRPGDGPDAHTVLVNGVWCSTLGHGITNHAVDVRAHAYFGDYEKVAGDLKEMRRQVGEGAHGVRGAVRRDEKSGLICGMGIEE